MAATIQTLKHGEPNWDAKVNANFQALMTNQGKASSYKSTNNIVGMNGAVPRTNDAIVDLYEWGDIFILHWDVHVDNVASWTNGLIKSAFSLDSDWIGKWTHATDFDNKSDALAAVTMTQDSWLASSARPGEMSLRIWGDASKATNGIDVAGYALGFRG